jgi:hypothetical protein
MQELPSQPGENSGCRVLTLYVYWEGCALPVLAQNMELNYGSLYHHR